MVTELLTIMQDEDIRKALGLRLIGRLQELESFDSEDQETVIKMFDAMIVKQRVEGRWWLLSTGNRPTAKERM